VLRLVWNKALDARTTAWYQRQERVSYVQSSAMLTQWKAGDDLTFLNEVSCVPLQQALRHLQGAFASFWDKRSEYPRFKSRRHSRASAEYTRSAFRWRGGELTLAKMAGPLDIRLAEAGTARPRETGNPGREARNPRSLGRRRMSKW
jgi:putative transposase